MSIVRGTVFFIDGTKMSFDWPRKEDDPTTITSKVKAGLESDKLVVEVSGEFIVVPASSIKYIHVAPGPSVFPEGVIRGGRITD